MAAEIVLRHLKNGELSNIEAQLKENLGPVVHSFDTLSTKELSSYGVFAVQFLHGSMAAFDSASPKECSVLVGAVDHCCDCLQHLGDHVRLKDPLTVQKVLLNILSKLCKKDNLEDCLTIAEQLKSSLKNLDLSLQASWSGLANSGHLLLWKKAHDLEVSRKSGGGQIELCLRRCSIDLLAMSGKDSSLIAERANAAVSRYCESVPRTDGKNTACGDLFIAVGNALKELSVKETDEPSIDIVCSYVEHTINHVQYLWQCGVDECSPVLMSAQAFLSKHPRNTKKTKELFEALVEGLTICEAFNSFNGASVHSNAQTKLAKTIEKSVAFINQSLTGIAAHHKVLICINKGFFASRQHFDGYFKTNCAGSTGFKDVFCVALENALQFFSLLLIKQSKVLEATEDSSVEKLRRTTASHLYDTGNTHLNLLLTSIKEEQCNNSSQVESVLKNARKVLSSLDEVVRMFVTQGTLSSIAQHNLGVTASKFGSFISNAGLYESAVEFYTIMCRQLQAFCDHDAGERDSRISECKLAKRFITLAYTQRSAQLYQDAADSVVKSLLVDSNHMVAACDCLVDIKRAMAKNGCTDSALFKRTLCLLVCQENDSVDEGFKTKLLLQELDATKERGKMIESQQMIIDQLLETTGQHRPYALTEQAALMWSQDSDSECAASNCKEAIKLLKEELDSHAPVGGKKNKKSAAKSGEAIGQQIGCKDDLARAHFWLYLCENREPEEIEQTSEMTNEGRSTTPTQDEDGLLSGPCFTLNMEYSSFENLDQAVELWDALAQNGGAGKLRNARETISLLFVASSIYGLANKTLSELKTVSILRRLTQQMEITMDYVESSAKEIQILLDLGRLGSAEALCKILEDKHGASLDVTKPAWLYYMLMKAHLLMYSKEIKDSWELASRVQASLSPLGKTKSVFFLDGICRRLLSQLSCLPSLYDSTSPPAGCAIDSACDAFRFHNGVVKYLKKGEAGDIVEKWRSMNQLLTTLMYMGTFFISIGDARTAKCYLKEGIELAQAFKAPRRVAAFLLELARLDMTSGAHEEAEAKLNTAYFILNSDVKMAKEVKGKKQTKMIAKETSNLEKDLLKKKLDCFGFDDSYHSDEDDFITKRPVTIEEENGVGDSNERDLTSSPSLKRKTTKLPSYLSHPEKCSCVACHDVSLHKLNLNHLVLESQVGKHQPGTLSQSGHVLEQALRLFKLASGKAAAALRDASDGLVAKDVSGNLYNQELATIYKQLACLSISRNAPRLVNDYVSKTDEVLERSTTVASCLEIDVEMKYLSCVGMITGKLTQRKGSVIEKDTISKKLDLTPEIKCADISSSVRKEAVQSIPVSTASRKGKTKKSSFVVYDDSTQSADTFKTPARPKPVSKRITSASLKLQTPQLSLGTPSIEVFEDDDDNQSVKKKVTTTRKKSTQCTSKKTSTAKRGKKEMDTLSFPPTLKLSAKSVSSLLKAFDLNSPEPKQPKTPVYKKPGKSRVPGNVENVYEFAGFSDEEILTSKLKAPRKAQRNVRSRIPKRQNADSGIEIFRDQQSENDTVCGEGSVPIQIVETNDDIMPDLQSVVDCDPDIVDPIPAKCILGKKSSKQTKSKLTKSKLKPEVTLPAGSRSTRSNREKLRAVIHSDDEEESYTIVLESEQCESDEEAPVTKLPTEAWGIEDLSLKPLTTVDSVASYDIGKIVGQISDLDSSIEIVRAGSDDENTVPVKKGRGRARGPRVKKTAEVADSKELLRSTSAASRQVKNAILTDAANKGPSTQLAKVAKRTVEPHIKQALLDSFSKMRRHPPCVLYRNICHSLALYALETSHKEAAFYLTEAAAVTFRHMASASIGSKIRKLRKEQTDDEITGTENMLMECRDMLAFNKTIDSFSQAYQCLVPEWTVCQVSVISAMGCQHQQLVVTRFRKNQPPLVIPMDGISASQDLLATFSNILTESKEGFLLSKKDQWWSHRHGCNTNLKTLLEDVEQQWLGCWRGVLLGHHSNQEDFKKVQKAAASLAKEFGCDDDSSTQLLEILVDTAHELSSSQLNTAVRHVFNESLDTARCDQIVSSIQRHNKQVNSVTSARQPVILVLDKDVQALPWENLPVLRSHPVSRAPSLYFIQSHLRALRDNLVYADGVDSKSVFYILNPEDNLPSTQQLFEDWFKNADGWKGVVGRQPTNEEIKEGLTDRDLYIYCGHGSGSKYYGSDNILSLQCRSAALLVGCSSGRLQARGSLEADGIVQKYLMAGCPSVLGNLWDVTDKDIDRFLENLLKTWMSKKNNISLSEAVSTSRDSCKLPYLVGAAPVVYGLPVIVKR